MLFNRTYILLTVMLCCGITTLIAETGRFRDIGTGADAKLLRAIGGLRSSLIDRLPDVMAEHPDWELAGKSYQEVVKILRQKQEEDQNALHEAAVDFLETYSDLCNKNTEFRDHVKGKRDPIYQVITQSILNPKDPGRNLADLEITSVPSAVGVGLAGACFGGLSKVVRERTESGMAELANPIIDGIFSGFKSVFNLLCYGTTDLLTSARLDRWSKDLEANFKQIEDMVSKAPRDGMRSANMLARNVQLSVDVDEETEKEVKTSWQQQAEGYVIDFAFVIKQLEKYRRDYQSNECALHYIDQLVKRLSVFSMFLAKATTLAEFDALFDSSKASIAAFRANVLALIEGLRAEVDPNAKKETKASSFASSSFDRNERDRDSYYPQPYGQGYGRS